MICLIETAQKYWWTETLCQVADFILEGYFYLNGIFCNFLQSRQSDLLKK